MRRRLGFVGVGWIGRIHFLSENIRRLNVRLNVACVKIFDESETLSKEIGSSRDSFGEIFELTFAMIRTVTIIDIVSGISRAAPVANSLSCVA